MKKIFRFLVLSLALMGIISACDILNPVIEPADLGLGIKVFFPTKVVTNQPMTINGSGFRDVTEIVFPNGVTVTNFEIVSNEMIRVNAPAGIAADGGTIIVRTATDQAESPQRLTVGRTSVSGFSKQAGEEISGGEQITIYGTDLEFINGVELLDADGNPVVLTDAAFFRKGTSSVVITIPKKVFEGTFTGKLFTYDGQEILMPELAYKPAAEGGHWEKKKTVIWENPDPDGFGAVNWNGTYRFANETNKTGEEIYAIPDDVWEMMKTTPFYMSYSAGDSYQIRVTTGWWGTQWLGKDNDIAPWNMAERIIDNGDGTFSILVDFSEDPEILETIDAQHLLFTGSGFTPLELYFEEEVWVGGGGEPKEVLIWEGDGSAGEVNWNGTYRFASETNKTGEEIYAIPDDVWTKMKATPFYMSYSAGDSYQIRVTTGWWGTQWLGKDNDIAPWNMAERIIDNGDGTFSILVDFSEDPEILETIDAQHLLFTGSGFTPLKLYFLE